MKQSRTRPEGNESHQWQNNSSTAMPRGSGLFVGNSLANAVKVTLGPRAVTSPSAPWLRSVNTNAPPS